MRRKVPFWGKFSHVYKNLILRKIFTLVETFFVWGKYLHLWKASLIKEKIYKHGMVPGSSKDLTSVERLLD